MYLINLSFNLKITLDGMKVETCLSKLRRWGILNFR